MIPALSAWYNHVFNRVVIYADDPVSAHLHVSSYSHPKRTVGVTVASPAILDCGIQVKIKSDSTGSTVSIFDIER